MSLDRDNIFLYMIDGTDEIPEDQRAFGRVRILTSYAPGYELKAYDIQMFRNGTYRVVGMKSSFVTLGSPSAGGPLTITMSQVRQAAMNAICLRYPVGCWPNEASFDVKRFRQDSERYTYEYLHANPNERTRGENA
jgi:hypothetical protein